MRIEHKRLNSNSKFAGSGKLPGLHEPEFKPKIAPAPEMRLPDLKNQNSTSQIPQQNQPFQNQKSSHRSQKSMEEIMALFEPPSRTSDFFQGPKSSQRPSNDTFQADFPPLDANSVIGNIGNIQLPADFWSPDFKAPQVLIFYRLSLVCFFCFWLEEREGKRGALGGMKVAKNFLRHIQSMISDTFTMLDGF